MLRLSGGGVFQEINLGLFWQLYRYLGCLWFWGVLDWVRACFRNVLEVSAVDEGVLGLPLVHEVAHRCWGFELIVFFCRGLISTMVLYGVLERPLGKMLCLVIELILLNCISKLILVFIHHSPIVGSIWNCIVLHYNRRAIRFRVLWFQIIPGDAIERPSSIILWMVCGQLHLGIACSYGIKFFKIIFILNHDRLFLIILAILIRNSSINHRGPVRSDRATYLPIPQPGRRLNETRARSIIMH